jgi:hypothetical protein
MRHAKFSYDAVPSQCAWAIVLPTQPSIEQSLRGKFPRTCRSLDGPANQSPRCVERNGSGYLRRDTRKLQVRFRASSLADREFLDRKYENDKWKMQIYDKKSEMAKSGPGSFGRTECAKDSSRMLFAGQGIGLNSTEARVNLVIRGNSIVNCCNFRSGNFPEGRRAASRTDDTDRSQARSASGVWTFTEGHAGRFSPEGAASRREDTDRSQARSAWKRPSKEPSRRARYDRRSSSQRYFSAKSVSERRLIQHKYFKFRNLKFRVSKITNTRCLNRSSSQGQWGGRRSLHGTDC